MSRALVDFTKAVKGRQETQLFEIYLKCEAEQERTAKGAGDLGGRMSMFSKHILGLT